MTIPTSKDSVNLLRTSKPKLFFNPLFRLSRYVLKESETDPLKESLRAHTDWTLTTPIPLSATPGLQLWRRHYQQCIEPESLVLDLPLPRTRCLVVMTGKWMELLTNQAVPACFHRVVSQTSQKTRLSAPFFLRPKEFVFTVQSLSDVFNDPERGSPLRCIRCFRDLST